MSGRATSTDMQAYLDEALAKARTACAPVAEADLIRVARIGIIGAGTMGSGIAMSFADIGMPVTVVEIDPDALDRGLAAVRASYARRVRRGELSTQQVERRLAGLTGTLEMADVAECDLVIEAAYEDMALKKLIFRQLDRIVKLGAILATNSSGLDVDEIAGQTGRPDAVIGLHFFSPANVMKLVEVVRGAGSSPLVVASAMRVVTEIGKIAVVVGVCPGFVGNRMLWARQLQAQALLRRGTMPWEIDRVLKAFGFKMGPFEMSDLAGLDIGWSRGAVTEDRLRDRLCEMGRRGQKSGAGYYDYPEPRLGVASDVVKELVGTLWPDSSRFGPPASDEDILDGCLFPLVNEGIRILDEGLVRRPSDIDLVWMFGFGWPRWTGGPMRWADSIGLDRVLDGCRALERQDPRCAPSPLLERLVVGNRMLTGAG